MKNLESVSRELMVHDKVLAKAAAAGKPLHFVLYDLRHSGRRAAQAGIDLATLAQILGHCGLRVVMKYVHPTAEHRKTAMLKYEQTMITQEKVCPLFVRLWPQRELNLAYPDATNEGTRRETQWIRQKH